MVKAKLTRKQLSKLPYNSPENQAERKRRAKKVKRGDGKISTIGQQELYENPYGTITIKPVWWEFNQDAARDFAIQLLKGYLWEIEYGENIHCQHREKFQVETILHRLEFYKGLADKKEWWPNEEEEIQLLLIDFVRILPSMWD